MEDMLVRIFAHMQHKQAGPEEAGPEEAICTIDGPVLLYDGPIFFDIFDTFYRYLASTRPIVNIDI
jgi:hypothetical protein